MEEDSEPHKTKNKKTVQTKKSGRSEGSLSKKDAVAVKKPTRLLPLPLTPACRWKCQMLLQRSLGEEDFLPVFSSDPIAEYARSVEEAVYNLTQNPYEYRLKVRQLIYNLRITGEEDEEEERGGGKYLMRTYSPDVLVTLTDDQLAEHTELRRQRLDYEARLAECRQLLQTNNIFEGLQSSVILAKCRVCGNTDLDYDFKQVRSADEGMNTYVTCKRCGKRWMQRG